MFFLSSFLVYSPIVASLGVLAFSQTRYYRTPRELPPLTLAGLAYGGCGAVAVRRGGVAQPQRHNRHRPTPQVLEGVALWEYGSIGLD